MFLKTYLVALTVFFLVDMIWLGLIAKDFYGSQLGFLLKPSFNWLAAILFYLIFTVGLVLFVVMPALEKGSWKDALIMGALFGLVTYATYDLTNLATLKDWPLVVTVVDLIWGSALGAAVSGVTYVVASKAA